MTISTTELHRLGPLEAIPAGEGRMFRVAGREIAVFRTRSGELYATQGRCPHRGAPLADGHTGAGRVVCPFHAYAFDLATGEAVANGCSSLRTYPATIDAQGDILVSVEEEESRQPCLA